MIISKNPAVWFAALFIAVSSPAGALTPEPVHASASEIASHLQLKWDLIENIYPLSNPYGEAHAAFGFYLWWFGIGATLIGTLGEVFIDRR